MTHFLDTVMFFFFWLLGCGIAIVLKVDDLNKMQERLTFKKAAGEFFKYEYKSYLISLMVGVLYGAGHDQVIDFLKNNKWTPEAVIEISGASPMIASAAYGFIFHLIGYKYFFGKLEKFYKRIQVSEHEELKAENEKLKAEIKPSDN